MPKTLKKAPLQEIIVELKWGDGAASPHQIGGMQALQEKFLTGGMSSHEEFYSQFGDLCSAKGLQRAERLVPRNFPQIPGQVVYRYQGESSSRILQVGPGVFTANAIPPYRSWDEFAPFLSSGYDTLLETKELNDIDSKFEVISIRYINAFSDGYLDKNTEIEIINSLGFDLNLPSKVKEVADLNDKDAHIALNYSVALNDGGNLAIVVGGGKNGQKKTVLFDISIIHKSVETGKVIDLINKSHSIIEEIFMEASKPFHNVMNGEE